MGDHHHAAAELFEQVFQPDDGVDIEVVGGLVEQQNIRLLHPGLCQRHAFFLAAGKVADQGVLGQAELADGLADGGIELPAFLCFDLALQFV